MPQLTHEQYSRIERAVMHAQRITVDRRGTEFVVVPLSLGTRNGREVIEARNPTTGDPLTLYLDELNSVETL